MCGVVVLVATSAQAAERQISPALTSPQADCNNLGVRAEHARVVMPSAPDIATGEASPLQNALQDTIASGTKTIYLRGGQYDLSHALVLDAGLAGITLTACPGERPVLRIAAQEPMILLREASDITITDLVFDGPNPVHVVLDRATRCTIENNMFLQAGTAILLTGASSNRIERNTILRSQSSGIELKDGSDKNRLADNTIDGTSAPETHGGGIFLHGASDNLVSHNLIRNTAGFGIGISNWDEATINLTNVVEYNLVQSTALTAADSGAIYILGRSSADTETTIAGNVVDGVGAPGRHNVGIYLDDSTSGAIVTRNLVRHVGSDALQIHGGSDNRVEDNIFDVSEGGPSAILFQRAPADTNPRSEQTDNVVARNIIMLASEDSKLFVSFDGGKPHIAGNLYASTTGTVTLPLLALADADAKFAASSIARDARDGNYAAAQSQGLAMGFRPVDIQSAGPRKSASSQVWLSGNQ